MATICSIVARQELRAPGIEPPHRVGTLSTWLGVLGSGGCPKSSSKGSVPQIDLQKQKMGKLRDSVLGSLNFGRKLPTLFAGRLHMPQAGLIPSSASHARHCLVLVADLLAAPGCSPARRPKLGKIALDKAHSRSRICRKSASCTRGMNG